MEDRDYTPADPTLQSWDHGLAELRLDGEVRAYLGCVVGEIRSRVPSPWPWFVVVWPDGSKEHSEEDYGPDWPAVRELDEGHFTYGARPSTERRHRFLGINLGVWREMCPDQVTYDVTWLPPAAATAAWRRLGLTDRDF